ncbi:MAG: DNA primase [Candidatus Kerfeldbacteria bacterium]|nr:DNA primase [Candidatus Kerfeldbacteria bacterium]
MPIADPVHEIKSRLSIVELIQEYVHLTKAGGNWRALCLFHQEKSPSFMVSEEKQMFHCFGCGEGGDIFTFIQKIEGVEFPEALRILARKANVPLPQFNPKLENTRTRVHAVVETAATFYQRLLQKDPRAEFARAYCTERQIDSPTLDLFRIGYAPDSWDATFAHLRENNFSVQEIVDAGMLVKKEKAVGHYDRFRNRLMIPIRDVHGRIIGFTSRTLDPNDKSAKYINTPETLIYHKGATLFNLDLAKSHIKQSGAAIVVEGNMDAIALTQAGFKNVVAVSGTAFTEQQITLLKRFTQTLLLAFDHDEAGFTALKRSVDEALAAELDLSVVDYPTGKDPDECVKKDPNGFAHAAAHTKPLGDYIFEKACEGRNPNHIQDKKKIAADFLWFLAKLKNSIEQSHYLKRLAETIGVQEDALHEALKKRAQKEKRPLAAKGFPVPVQKKNTVQQDLESELMGLLLRFPEHLDTAIENFNPDLMQEPFIRELYKSLILYYTEHGFSPGISFSEPHLHSFLQRSSDRSEDDFEHESGILLLASERVLESADENTARKEIKIRIRRLKTFSIQSKLHIIEQTIRELERGGGNESRVSELSREFRDLTDELLNCELI